LKLFAADNVIICIAISTISSHSQTGSLTPKNTHLQDRSEPLKYAIGSVFCNSFIFGVKPNKEFFLSLLTGKREPTVVVKMKGNLSQPSAKEHYSYDS